MFSVISNKKNMLLEKCEEDRIFRVSFTTKEKNQGELINLIIEDMFFDLLYELNDDLISYYKSFKSSDEIYNKEVIVKFDKINEEDEEKKIYLNLKTNINHTKNGVQIVGKNGSYIDPDLEYKKGLIDDIIIMVENNGENLSIVMTFKVIDKTLSVLYEDIMGFMITKVLYRVKQYIE
jgi:hypothetical protein